MIYDVFHKIKNSYSIDNIYFYQDFLLSAIMKYLFFHVIYLAVNNYKSYVKDVFKWIMIVYRKILRGERIFPTRFVDGFKILRTHADPDDNIRTIELNEFYEKLNNVQLNKIDTRQITSTHTKSLLNDIKQKIDDFKCFQQTYKYFNYKNYNPFLKSNILLSSYSSSSEINNKTICDFIIAVTSILSKCQTLKHMDIDNHIKEIHDIQIFVDFSVVKDSFLFIIRERIYYYGLRK